MVFLWNPQWWMLVGKSFLLLDDYNYQEMCFESDLKTVLSFPPVDPNSAPEVKQILTIWGFIFANSPTSWNFSVSPQSGLPTLLWSFAGMCRRVKISRKPPKWGQTKGHSAFLLQLSHYIQTSLLPSINAIFYICMCFCWWFHCFRWPLSRLLSECKKAVL